MITFPEGFQCSAELNARYMACHSQFEPVIERKARMIHQWARHQLEFEDLCQEGRITFLKALNDYDENRTDSNLRGFVSVMLDNRFRSMFWAAVAQCRMPRGYIRDYDGEWQQRRFQPMSLDQMLDADVSSGYKKWEPASEYPDPEEHAVDQHLSAEARRFRMKLLNTLDPTSKRVFQTKFNPTTADLMMIDNLGIELDINKPEIPNIVVARILKLNKSVIDHCMYKIKDRFTEMAKDRDFSDLFADVVGSKGWPMIYIDMEECHNRAFVKAVLERRNLDPRPLDGWDAEPDHFQKGKNCARWIARYSWGLVMALQYEGEWRTVVMEGERVNLTTGAVFGSRGVQEELVHQVPWYRDLVKRLKAAEKEAKHG